MDRLKIIAKYTNGRMIKGTTGNFWPANERFSMVPLGARPNAPPVPVSIKDLKAIFFVHTFGGRRNRAKRAHFMARDRVFGHKLRVAFFDGELLEGAALDYDLNTPGFFLHPADPDSNNERIFVVSAAVKDVKHI